MLDIADYEKYRQWWKKQAPGSPGFQRSYSAETPLGDILQVDFNFHESLVKIQLEVSRERGKTYVATVKNGSIIKEKDVTSARNLPLYNKIYPYKDLLSCLPDKDLLESLSGAYDVYIPDFPKEEREKPADFNEFVSTKYDHIFGIRRETWLQKYFRRRREEKERIRLLRDPLRQRIRRRFFGEVSDLILGSAISFLVYNYYFDFILTGLMLGIMGFFTGGLDWWIRKRDPLLTKVMLFILAGSWFFYNGYTRY